MLAAVALAVGLAGCGEEERPLPPTANTPKVALTVNWPGVQPWALITYTRQDGERCAALGSLTTAGPRVLGALGQDLTTGLTTRGECLTSRVLIDVEANTGRELQVVGGIAAPEVKRLRVAGQVVRPKKDGTFLLIHADPAHRLGTEVEVVLRGGSRTSVPFPPLQTT